MDKRIEKRDFFICLAALVILLAALDTAVGFGTRHSVPRRVMDHARASQSSSVLALGNSLVASGFSETSFDQGMGLSAPSGSVNLALGGSSPAEQILLARYAFQHGIHPRKVIYGFYDFQLTQPLAFTTQDLIGNRAMLYYVEPEYGRTFYWLSLHDRIEFEIMRHFELFADRSAVWGRVERFRRLLAQQGMPAEKSNSMGRVNDFALLTFPNTDAFAAECDREINAAIIEAVRQIAVQSEAQNSKVYFIEMPMPPAHVQAFYDSPGWSRYREHLVAMLGALNVSFIDASEWMGSKSDFADPLHLTNEAASQFSYRLGVYIRALKTE